MLYISMKRVNFNSDIRIGICRRWYGRELGERGENKVG